MFFDPYSILHQVWNMSFSFWWQNCHSCARGDLTRISRSDCQIIGDDQSPLPTAVSWILKNLKFHIQLWFIQEWLHKWYLHNSARAKNCLTWPICPFDVRKVSHCAVNSKLAMCLSPVKAMHYTVSHLFTVSYVSQSNVRILDPSAQLLKLKEKNIVCCKVDSNISWGN